MSLYVTAGFFNDGEAVALVLHNGSKESYARARGKLRTRAAPEKVADFETQPAEKWLASDVVECVDIGQ